MCTHCYDAARARNEYPPMLARGARAALTSSEFDKLVHHATHVIPATRDCEEVDAWEMTSLCGYLLGTEAVYRAPFDEQQRWFMLQSNLRYSN